MKNSEDGLFSALETVLRAATEPMDAPTLFDMACIKEHAASTNRVSDYLGNMWRKGQVVRMAAPRTGNSRAQWVYSWKGQRGPKILDAAATLEYGAKVLADRPSVLITEEGSVITLEFPTLIIQIKQKPSKK